MNLDFLPDDIFTQVIKMDLGLITEIRLRIGYPLVIKINGKTLQLLSNQFKVTHNHIQYIVDKVTERSIYAFNNCIKQGFLTTSEGVRIGLGGECVFEDNKVVTIKKITSLNIRIPHFIKNCSEKIFPYIYSNNSIYNSIIVSPPAKGKTTLLKDIIYKFNNINAGQILVIDERNEFALINGENIDKIVYSDKLFAFDYALRSMSPEIVITDELCSKSDWEFVASAVNSGVKIITTCHASTINDLKQKNYFIKNVFNRYIILRNCDKCGVLDKVYDEEFNVI